MVGWLQGSNIMVEEEEESGQRCLVHGSWEAKWGAVPQKEETGNRIKSIPP